MGNIVFIDHTSKLGGGELALKRYLEWSDKSHTVDLIVFEEGELAQAARQAPGTTVHVLESSSKQGRVLELDRLLKKLPGLVVANSLSSLIHVSFLPHRLRGRLVYYLRHEAYTTDTPRLKRLFMQSYLFPFCKGFLANSRFTLKTLADPSLEAKGQVVYTVAGISATPLSENISEPGRPLKVLSLSRLTPWKGVHRIVEAVNAVNRGTEKIQVELTVAGGALFGEEKYEAELKRMAQETPGSVNFTGHVQDVTTLLKEHDVLVSASIKPEPLGQVIIQGLSQGLVVLATDQGGAQELVENGKNGFLLQPDSGQAIARILTELVDSKTDTLALRQAATQSAEAFSDSRTLLLLDDALTSYLT